MKKMKHTHNILWDKVFLKKLIADPKVSVGVVLLNQDAEITGIFIVMDFSFY
nr:hypothetical protein [Paenibacillus agricola]